MQVTKSIQTLKRLHGLIDKGSTGSPKQLGRKLGISERQARQYVNELKSLGAHIKYSRTSQTYLFVNFVELSDLLKV